MPRVPSIAISQNPRLLRAILPAAALIAIAPLLRDGPSCGHDFDFHLLSWFEAAGQFAHGSLHPGWAALPAYGAGEPRFVFYPPLSWALGALLTLALTHLPHLAPAIGFSLVPLLFTWIALTTAGLAAFTLARRFVDPVPALLAATLYLANPYLLFTAFERTAYGELLAATFFPLLLAALLPLGSDHELPSISRIALPLALLWLTNAPAGVMGSYLLALVVVLRLAALWREPRVAAALLLRAVAGTLLGLALAGFYLVPAIYEQRWVEVSMAIMPGMRIVDNTLFHHTPDAEHDAVLQTVSLVALVLIGLSASLLAVAARRRAREALALSLVPRLALLAAVFVAALTPLSLPFWRLLPELSFLQFPWRFLAILAVVLSLSAALALRSLRLRPWAAGMIALLLAGAVAVPTASHFVQGCDTGETPRDAFATIGSATNVAPTDEYTPTPADNDALRLNNPPFRLARDPESPTPANAQSGPAPRHLDLDVRTPEFVILNLRSYPAWQARLNGAPIPHGPDRDDGLLTLELPAGHDRIDLSFVRTRDHTAGDVLSLLALLTYLAIGYRERPRRAAARLSA